MYTEIIRKIQNKGSEMLPTEAASLILAEFKNTYPIEIVNIARNMGFKVFSSDTLDNDDSGIIGIDANLNVKYGSNKCVIVNSNIKAGKKRFVLAHELGHYLFEFNELKEMSFYHSYNKDSKEDENEIKANEFAASLLMPSEDFIKSYEKSFKKKIALVDIVVELSEKFGVTTKSVQKRISELELV